MVPKKVKSALLRLGIKGVVNGYTTINKDGQAAFTGWDLSGKPLIVLYKAKNSDWSLKPEKRM